MRGFKLPRMRLYDYLGTKITVDGNLWEAWVLKLLCIEKFGPHTVPGHFSGSLWVASRIKSLSLEFYFCSRGTK